MTHKVTKKKLEHIAQVMKLLKRNAASFQTTALMEIAETNRSSFQVLISCILSLRTKDEVTAQASKRLYELGTTPKEILALNIKQIEKAIYPVGFYKTKAKSIKGVCKRLLDEYNGKVPKTMEELLTFKGVGKKTAAIVMVYGHGSHDFIPVDVHVHVIANRLGWIKTKHADDSMDDLMRVVPQKYWHDLNDLFVQFGQNVCITISPKCSSCFMNKLCPRIGVTQSR